MQNEIMCNEEMSSVMINIVITTAKNMPILYEKIGPFPVVLNLVIPNTEIYLFRNWATQMSFRIFSNLKKLLALNESCNSEPIFLFPNYIVDERTLFRQLLDFQEERRCLVVVVTSCVLSNQNSYFWHVSLDSGQIGDVSVFEDFADHDSNFIEAECQKLIESGINSYLRVSTEFLLFKGFGEKEKLYETLERLLDSGDEEETDIVVKLFSQEIIDWAVKGFLPAAVRIPDLRGIKAAELEGKEDLMLLEGTQLYLKENIMRNLIHSFWGYDGVEAVKAKLVEAGVIISFNQNTGSFVKRLRLNFCDIQKKGYFIVLEVGDIFTEDGLSLADVISSNCKEGKRC